MCNLKSVFSLTFSLLVCLLPAQGWQSQNTGFGQSFGGVHCANELESRIAGENGLVLYTSDGGINWQQQNSGVTASLQDISFCDENNGTAAGLWGAIIHTTNGGSTWNVVQDGWFIDYSAAKMVTENIAFVAGQNTIFSPLVTYTANGWQSMNSVSYYLEQTPGNYHEGRCNDIEYIDANTWYTANAVWQGDGAIARTTNGGSSWQTVFWTINSLTGIYFPSPSVGYAVGENGAFLTSSDGGNSWTETFIPGSALLRDVHFTDELTGWVAGANGFIAATSDGGITWQIQNSGTYTNLTSIHFADELTGRVCGEGGTTLFTTTGGQQSGTLEGIVFLDAGSGAVQEVTITIDNTSISPDETGFFQILLLPGIYDLTAELEPYDPVLIEDIEISAGQTTTLNITLYYNLCAPPANLILLEDLWQLCWQTPDTSLDVLYYNCYLEEILETTTDTLWQLPTAVLVNGQEYTAGVAAVYVEGESEIITLDFIYTGVSADEGLNNSLYLSSHPNPFNPSTTIHFQLNPATAEDSELLIFNLKGQRVKSFYHLPINDFPNHQIIWDGRDENGKLQPSGVYLLKLRSGDFQKTHKILLLK